MKLIYRTNLKAASLLTVMLSTTLLTIGCGTTTKEDNSRPSSQPVLKQFSEPSLAYMSTAHETVYTDPHDAEAWTAIAQKNYEAKHYARALRSANEALKRDSQMVDARQIAMLSTVKVMEGNIAAYHDNVALNDDKATFKETLTNITTLISASN